MNINELKNQYQILIQKYGKEESHKALKKEYSDICSSGDSIINELIDLLDMNGNIEYFINQSSNKPFIQELIQEYLLETISNFVRDGLHASPFWSE